MAGVRECPQCETINPPTAQACDCGYRFDRARDTEVYANVTIDYLTSGAVKLGAVLVVVSILCFVGLPESQVVPYPVSKGFFLIFLGGIVSILKGLKRKTRKPLK